MRLRSGLALLCAWPLAACNAMTWPCLSAAPRTDVVGSWSYAGRRPGSNVELDDSVNPRAESLELLPDGTYTQRYAGEALARIRERYPEAPAVREGRWDVARYCAGELFLPSEWLRLYPGRVRHFELEGDRLTIFYPFGSGLGHEVYERRPAQATE